MGFTDSWAKTKPVLEKILTVLKSDKDLKEEWFYGYAHRKYVTAETISAAAANHLFDGRPELFNITKDEGHTLREHMANYGPFNDDDYPEEKALVAKYFPEDATKDYFKDR